MLYQHWEEVVTLTNYAVELKNVCKRFPLPTGGELEACKDINITLEKGESLGIVGESGSGKTTLVRMIMKMLPITEGEIYVDGVEIQHMNSEQTKEYRKKIQMVFQDPSAAFNPRMKVKDIILEPLYNFGLLEKGKEEQIAGDYLEMVDLPREFMHRYPHEMSGGQRQRVAIARAIINQPRVVLLDEPLSALDLKLRTEMQYELRELQQRLGITFVFVTHDQEEALAMSDWIFVMNDGEIVQSGTPVDIYDEPINHFVATFIGESNILPGVMIEDYLVEFNGKRFESVDGGMRPNEPVEVVIRPEDLQITLPEEGKLQVRVETQLFRGVHYEIIAYDNLGNEWMIHSTRKAIEGEIIGLDFTPEDIHIMRLNETEEEFDARIEEYVEVEEHEDGLINAIEEERYEENS